MGEELDTLVAYLQSGREALVWKLEGLGEYDVRRPLTPTGTNLLGLVQHCASVEAGYFGETFGRPFPEHLPWWSEDADPNDDLWVTPDRSREDVVGQYRRVWDWAATTFRERDLASTGEVAWWPAERRQVRLHAILVHVATEVHRHAGHADILREGLDGAVGRGAANTNLPEGYDWPAHVARVEAAARAVG